MFQLHGKDIYSMVLLDCLGARGDQCRKKYNRLRPLRNRLSREGNMLGTSSHKDDPNYQPWFCW
jgi:hypothetical protein